MRTKDTFLNYKLEKAIARIKTSSGYTDSPIFLEICNCPSKGGSLFYDTKKAIYFGKGSCNKGLLCSKIQKDKHQVLIRRTTPRLLEIEQEEKALEREPMINFSPQVLS